MKFGEVIVAYVIDQLSVMTQILAYIKNLGHKYNHDDKNGYKTCQSRRKAEI